ncbi:hypothetical protein SAMN05892883_2185 [Jatrophihabitans sp. GAS493]|uniref:hypothetical protein n=1 Tax=Jatrophihabitans sp. GAS493 TaxID=1907575 RepID=UPI000BB8E69A|nr:hypothetical protein [Jatrophihabitans sp. GAS493]SOD72862.1 hypothetical protein SAMN05892883_2185 [Jatrophihabitans sp. GAS493]
MNVYQTEIAQAEMNYRQERIGEDLHHSRSARRREHRMETRGGSQPRSWQHLLTMRTARHR